MNDTQIVNLLPHEQYSLFMKEVEMLDKMHTCLPDHSKCDQYAETNAGIKCLLPLLHADNDSLQSSCKIQNVVVVDRAPVVAGGLERRTGIMEKENETSENDPTEKHVNDKLQTLLTTL